MAKKTKDNIIALEIEKYEKKIKEYQDYLEKNTIISKVDKDTINLEQESQDKKHKEILIQIRLMDALPNWLEALKKLKQESENTSIELRGDSEMNDVFKRIKGIKE